MEACKAIYLIIQVLEAVHSRQTGQILLPEGSAFIVNLQIPHLRHALDARRGFQAGRVINQQLLHLGQSLQGRQVLRCHGSEQPKRPKLCEAGQEG